MGLGFQFRQQAKMLSQNVYLPAVYEAHRKDKVERGLIIFADAHHDRRPEAMELLYRKMKNMADGGKADAAGKYAGDGKAVGDGKAAGDGKAVGDGKAAGDTKAAGGGKTSIRIVEMYLDFGRASRAKVLQFSTQFMRLYARASVVVICDNFLPVASCRKKDETLVVQLWHACGCYKKFGYDAADDIPEGYKGDVFRNMDLVTVSAEAAVKPFMSAMHKTEGQVQALGVSRTDLYFSEKWRQMCEGNFRMKYPQAYEVPGTMVPDTGENTMKPSDDKGLREPEMVPDTGENTKKSSNDKGLRRSGMVSGTGEDAGKAESVRRRKVVLWAPTFRGNAGVPELLDLDVERLQKELGDEYLVLTRVHPHMKAVQKAQSHNCPIPTELLYPVVDVLIADYSSLIYEYLLVKEIERRAEEDTAAGKAGEGRTEEAGRGVMTEVKTARRTAGSGSGGLVLYVPDLDEYESGRGFYMDIREIPGQIVGTEEGLADAIREAAQGDGRVEATKVFLGRYMSACDGHATERIARVIEDHVFQVSE